MLRSAAKNHESVIVVVDPTDYGRVLDLLRRGEVPRAVRQEFAAKVFSHTADYDGAIARYLTPAEDGMPHRIGWSFERLMSLRYGENPTQRAALYVDEEPRGLRDLKQRQGKELSFNNILDLDAAMWAVSLWQNVPSCAIIKHTTPCGLAIAATAEEAFKKALASDPQSAFGGVVAFNTVVDRVTAVAIRASHRGRGRSPRSTTRPSPPSRPSRTCAPWSCRSGGAPRASTSSGCAAGCCSRTVSCSRQPKPSGSSPPRVVPPRRKWWTCASPGPP
jgi:AICAR transformylase/IMP cyclohydrolase PurH